MANQSSMKERKDEFVKELDELREIEVDINLNMLTYSDIEKCDSDKYSTLTVRDMEALDIMLK